MEIFGGLGLTPYFGLLALAYWQLLAFNELAQAA